MQKILFFFTLLFCTATARSQQRAICGFDETFQRALNEDPAFRQRIAQSNLDWENFVELRKNTAQRLVVEGNDTIYEIPVVIHVIDTGGAVGTLYNRTDADLIAWIDYLNQVLAATWPANPTTSSGGVKIPIRFVRAKKDPNCNATNGIVRVNAGTLPGYTQYGLQHSGTNGATEADIKNLSRWPPQSYYNIYTVNKIDGIDGYTATVAFVAGFAYLAGASLTSDGTFMLAYAVNTSSDILPHEIGHALGLYHTFNGAGAYPDCATETNCTTQGDYVCDTEHSPNNLSQNPCPTNSMTNPCTNANYNGVQYNIMNYGICSDRFTQGQADRAIQQLLSLRQSLINSAALDTASVSPASAALCAVTTNHNPSNNFNFGPTNVSIGSLNYTSNGYNNDNYSAYIDHTQDVCYDGSVYTTLVAGSNYTLNVSVATNPQRVKAFIDYNNDGVFTNAAPELIMNIDNVAAGGTATITVTPPATAVLNTSLRMRIMSDAYSGFGAPNYAPCDTLVYGQTEDFTVKITSGSPLAVQLKDFNAAALNCSTHINWSWADKKAVSKLELQSSNDGRNFYTLESYASITTDVSYNDLSAGNGLHFYRLKWIDNTGATQYSTVKTTTINCDAAFKVYPNPFNKNVSINYSALTNGNATIAAYDLTGKEVAKQLFNTQTGNNHFEMDLSNLPDAVYLLKIQNGTDSHHQMIVKTNK